MNTAILEEPVQQFIESHLKDDVHRLAMSKSPFPSVSAKELAAQIAAKGRTEKKLPTWFNTLGIYYPQMLSVEQCSSEKTASYKSTLITHGHVLDLTGGFGVDCIYFAKLAEKVTHCELMPELSAIAKHNAAKLGVTNIKFMNVDGIEYLQNTSDTFSTIYIDPARRGKSGKVFMLKDCSPNVVEHLSLLLSKAPRVIIKTSPLLDISAGIKELRNVAEVQIISVKNECKELLFILEAGANTQTKITSVTINEQIKMVSFGTASARSSLNNDAAIQLEGDTSTSDDGNPALSMGRLKQFLYEPDVALLKSGAFNTIGELFNLVKLDLHTQLYTSDEMNPAFPGRIFKLQEVLTKTDLKKQKNLTGNVIVRNYPGKPEELIKAFKIKPAATDFLLFTQVRAMGYVILKASILQHY